MEDIPLSQFVGSRGEKAGRDSVEPKLDTNSQYLFLTNAAVFLRLLYVPWGPGPSRAKDVSRRSPSAVSIKSRPLKLTW